MKIGFCLKDDAMPRTEYWQAMLDALAKHADDSDPQLLIPAEDTAVETNWPRYGNPASAYIRGQPHEFSANGPFQTYLARFIAFAKENPAKRFLYINMHPFFRVPSLLRQAHNVVVADVSLAMFERALNPRTISLPTLPIVYSRSTPSSELRPIMASFQGVMSHPVRQVLKNIANGTSIVVNFVDRARHSGKIDAINAQTDREYEKLLENSNFAFVPRGDALFSYRLSEVMSFGCIPIVLSDGWVLPFDRTLRWDDLGLQVHIDAIQHLPQILASLSKEEIVSRRKAALSAFHSHFATLNQIVPSMLLEAEALLRNQTPSN